MGLFYSQPVSYSFDFLSFPPYHVSGLRHRGAAPERTVGELDGHIDWLTWTQQPERQPESITELYHIARRTLRGLSDEHERWLFDGQGFDRTARQANFNLCLSRDDNGVIVGGQGPTGLMLFTATGRACQPLHNPAYARRIVGEVGELVTRFDYAIDFPADTLPSKFANARSHQGFRTVSFIRSDTGETVYVGSRKSDRFARVYRYNPPHPRSHLLRVEFVFRRAMARSTAVQYCAEESDERFCAKLFATWGFNHPITREITPTDERIAAPTVDRHTEDTIAWLYKQVVPALQRVMATGGFDMTDFLEKVYNQEV